jgi:hypothetical protein
MRHSCLLILTALVAVEAETRAAELTTKELLTARKTYVTKCAKCHRFYEPKDYSAADWQRWMNSMNNKSKLKPTQAGLLTRYLDAYRAGRLTGKPEAKPTQE